MPKRLRASFWLDCGIKAVEFDAAAGGPQKRGEHFDGGGFAGAVRPQESEDFALRDLEGDVVDGSEIAERFDQIADGNHSRIFLLSKITILNGLVIRVKKN